MGPGEQSIQYDGDTVVIDQTCTPVVLSGSLRNIRMIVPHYSQ